MTKPVRLLYTFIDERTCNLADILAPNESTARLWLGGRWMIIDRCSVFGTPAPVGNWDKVISEAEQEAAEQERAGHQADQDDSQRGVGPALQARDQADVSAP